MITQAYYLSLRKKARLLLAIVLLFFISALSVNAQIQSGGQPRSFTNKPYYNLLAEKMPTVPGTTKSAITQKNGRMQFAHPFAVKLNPQNSGLLKTLKNGDKWWRLKIESEGAYSLNILFDTFEIPEGAALFIYNQERTEVLGAFTSANNKKSKKLAIAPINGSVLFVEYFEPKTAIFKGNLNISQVNHAFIKTLKGTNGLNDSGNCNININCETGNLWQQEKRAVVKLIINGIYLCTAALLNNEQSNATPYLLTANHCISDQNEAENTVFYFNYEVPICGTPKANELQTISGADLVATVGNIDFALLKLTNSPPANYRPYFAGWDVTDQISTPVVSIHHPSGDVKKISVASTPIYTATFPETPQEYLSNSHWQIPAWSEGTTEGGSSGSPLFNTKHQIIGDLTGGDASCAYNFDDYYSKISFAWNYHPEENRQLKHWLDPLNTGIRSLAGHDPYAEALSLSLIKITEPEGVLDNNSFVPSIYVNNSGSTAINSFEIAYGLVGQTQNYFLWEGILEPFKTIELTLPALTAEPGSHTFSVSLSSPNGQTDSNLSDNVLQQLFTIRKAYDLQILDTITNQMICSSNHNHNITLSNYGINTINSFTIEYGATQTINTDYLWVGELLSDEKLKISLQDIYIPNHLDTFTFALSKINTIELTNKITHQVATSKGLTQIAFNFTSDDYPNENHWEIRDSENSVVYNSPAYPEGSPITITDTFCLSKDCYTFEFTDSYDDGICCSWGNGSFFIENVQTNQIISSGAVFESNYLAQLCFPENDIAISKLIAPNAGFSPQTITPKLQITNMGYKTVTNPAVSYAINDVTETVTHTGSLARYQSATVNLPNIGFTEGRHEIIFKVNPNNSSDEYPYNNILKHNLVISDGYPLSIALTTGPLQNTTSWELKVDGKVFYSSGIAPAGSTQLTLLNVPYGCHKLVYKNKGNNEHTEKQGIGSLSIYNSENQELVWEALNFSRTDTVATFCVTTNLNQLSANENNIQIYPNPAHNFIQIDSKENTLIKIEIIALSGKTLISQNSDTRKLKLNILGLAPNVYLLKIVTQNQTLCKKIVIQ